MNEWKVRLSLILGNTKQVSAAVLIVILLQISYQRSRNSNVLYYFQLQEPKPINKTRETKFKLQCIK